MRGQNNVITIRVRRGTRKKIGWKEHAPVGVRARESCLTTVKSVTNGSPSRGVKPESLSTLVSLVSLSLMFMFMFSSHSSSLSLSLSPPFYSSLHGGHQVPSERSIDVGPAVQILRTAPRTSASEQPDEHKNRTRQSNTEGARAVPAPCSEQRTVEQSRQAERRRIVKMWSPYTSLVCGVWWTRHLTTGNTMKSSQYHSAMR